MFKIEFSRIAGKQLEKIFFADKKLYSRIIFAIETLAKEPEQGKQLKGVLSGDFSLRIGDYRVIYTIYEKLVTIYIIDVGHRKEIYR
jgi:mRNA interferase RelE/StbE